MFSVDDDYCLACWKDAVAIGDLMDLANSVIRIRRIHQCLLGQFLIFILASSIVLMTKVQAGTWVWRRPG